MSNPNTSIQEQSDKLLVSRYKLIAHYPGCKQPIGSILTINDSHGKILVHQSALGTDFENAINPESYPHLFKKLEWHQGRAKSEMPKYVRWTNPGTKEISFFEVVQWLTNSAGIYTAGTKDAYLFIKDILPATEQEYLNYKNTQS